MMEIVPFNSVDVLCFGATRTSIRERLGGGYQSFRKVVGANETDVYDALGLHLYFDDDERLEFVEAFDPASPSFRGALLLGRDRDEVAADLTAMGYDLIQDAYGLRCDGAGLSLTAPDGIVEGVGVFRKGYYGD
jgi:hypothetical protein